jgi:hypothetical protein
MQCVLRLTDLSELKLSHIKEARKYGLVQKNHWLVGGQNTSNICHVFSTLFHYLSARISMHTQQPLDYRRNKSHSLKFSEKFFLISDNDGSVLSKSSDGCWVYTIQIPFSLQEMQSNMAGILSVIENPKL